MNNTILLGGIIGFLILGLIGGFATYNNMANSPDVYTGKILFKDDASYVNFKETLLDKDVKVNTLNSLSSDEHFVDIRISVPHDYDFPYGKSTSHNNDLGISLTVAFALGLGGVGFGSIAGIAFAHKPS